jgi:hypothetical protein
VCVLLLYLEPTLTTSVLSPGPGKDLYFILLIMVRFSVASNYSQMCYCIVFICSADSAGPDMSVVVLKHSRMAIKILYINF